MTTKVLLIILMFLLPSIAVSCNCNDSWMIGRNAIILVAGSFVDSWYNVTIQNTSNGFVLVDGYLATNKDITIYNKWINKNFIWSISGL